MIEAVKKIKNNRGYVILFFIVMAIACAFSFMCLIHTSSKASQRAGLEMDTLYLKELTTQTIGHFQTGISSHFSQLRTSAASIKEEDLINEDTLAAYFKRIQEYNNFNFLHWWMKKADIIVLRAFSGGLQNPVSGTFTGGTEGSDFL